MISVSKLTILIYTKFISKIELVSNKKNHIYLNFIFYSLLSQKLLKFL